MVDGGAGKGPPRADRGGCCAKTPRFRCVFGVCLAAATLLVVVAGAKGVSRAQHRRTQLVRGGAAQAAPAAADAVWHGVESVNASAPQLCRAGADLVCAQYDAVVVLGGGPADAHGALPEWVKRRCDVVLELYSCCRAAGGRLTVITTSAGTAHAPNAVDEEGFHVSEARASSRYLVARGISPADIVEESAGTVCVITQCALARGRVCCMCMPGRMGTVRPS
jgi:hypothetical protein